MTDNVEIKASRLRKWTLLGTALLMASSAIVIINSLITQSMFIGIPASFLFLFICSKAMGSLFFRNEKRFLQESLGLASFALVMALLGTVLILVARFAETISLVSLLAVGIGIHLVSIVKRPANIQSVSKTAKEVEKRELKAYLLVIAFMLSVGIALYALLTARTGEGEISVWLTIPDFFLPVFFLSSLSLVVILFFTRINVGLKLSLVSVYSFLSHSLFLMVWYPGRYGDQWSQLGEARFIDRVGTFYAYDYLMSQRLIADIVKYKSQFALVVLLERMFTLDIYWVHISLVPVLWSIFLPVFFYKLAELLMTKNTKLPLFAAFGWSVFSPLILWGTVSVPNSLGFLFLLFSIVFLLYWMHTREKRVISLSLLACAGALFAHPSAGIFSFILVFVGVVVQSRMNAALKAMLVLSTFIIYPLVSILQGASFSLAGLLNIGNFVAFQSDLTTILLAFGFLGLMFSIRGRLVKSKSAVVLFLFYVIVASNYYVAMYGMTDAPVPDRILPITYFLFVPFLALGLLATTNILKAGLSRVSPDSLKSLNPRSFAVLLICLLLSVLATSVLYQAYPSQEITDVQPAAYEVDAVRYIDSTAPGRYVVLGDTNLATVAAGFLGIDYSYGAGAKGTWGIPEWDFWTLKLSSKMAQNPSLSVLEEAMFHAYVGVAYFVISIRAGQGWFEDVVRRTSAILPVDRIFGDGKLYVFKYQSTLVPVSGEGPSVKVTFDDGTSAPIQSEFDYFVKSGVHYMITLTGHSSYNITDYPSYWTFLSLKVNDLDAKFDDSSDINTFIYKSGLREDDFAQVTWQANEHYPVCGWKEDSFKTGWQEHPYYPTNPESPIVPNIARDGNVLNLSWDFGTYVGKYQYYYYIKRVNIPTNDFPFILVRWKSTAPIMVLSVAYASDETSGYNVVPMGSESQDWSQNIVQLQANQTVAYVTVGMTNLLSGPDYSLTGVQTINIDYILFSAQAP